MGLMTCSSLPPSCDVDGTDDVFQKSHTGTGIHIKLYGNEAHCRDNFVVVGTHNLTGLLGRHRDPSPRHFNHRLSIHQTVAVAVGYIPVHTIHLPVLSLQVDLLGCSDHDVLDIPPGQVWVGFQAQSNYGRGHGSTS